MPPPALPGGPIIALLPCHSSHPCTPLPIPSSHRLSVIAILALAAVSAIAIGWMVFLGGGSLVTEILTNAANRQGAGSAWWLAAFFAVAVLTQLLVVPSGSVLLVAAGFVFGAPLAAGLYAAAQMLTAWPVFAISQHAIRERHRSFWSSHVERVKTQPLLQSLDALRRDSFFATITLRLTPVIPSAVACVLAAMSGLSMRGFLLGTLASCWIRPLFFASAGASVRTAGQLSQRGYEFSMTDVAPLLILFAAAVLILVIRLVLYRKTKRYPLSNTGRS